jgi:hypothetical protein
MLAASRRHPHLVCQLTPTSTTYKIDRVLQRLVGEGFLGELLSVEVQHLQTRFADRDGELHWRHDWLCRYLLHTHPKGRVWLSNTRGGIGRCGVRVGSTSLSAPW